MSMEKKKEKIAMYSCCKSNDGTDDGSTACKCSGWKNPNAPQKQQQQSDGVGGDGTTSNSCSGSQGANVLTLPVDMSVPCRACNHTLSDHISHLENVEEDQLNRLLAIVVDLESLFIIVNAEEDADTKQVYYYLFKLLRKSIVTLSKPIVEGPLGQPPFEQPSITKVSLFI